MHMLFMNIPIVIRGNHCVSHIHSLAQLLRLIFGCNIFKSVDVGTIFGKRRYRRPIKSIHKLLLIWNHWSLILRESVILVGYHIKIMSFISIAHDYTKILQKHFHSLYRAAASADAAFSNFWMDSIISSAFGTSCGSIGSTGASMRGGVVLIEIWGLFARESSLREMPKFSSSFGYFGIFGGDGFNAESAR